MKKKGGLGKGLSLLIGEDKGFSEKEIYINNSSTSEEYLNSERIIELSIDDILIGKYQPRKTFNDEKIDELVTSIKHNGVMVPVLVRRGDESRYELIAGERRIRAVKKLGITKIAAIVKNLTHKEAQEYSLVENIQREDLNPIEEAEGYLKLTEEFGYTQENLSSIVGKSRSHISNLLRVLSLEESVKNLLAENKISLGHAKLLVGLDNAVELAKIANDQSLSVRGLENIIKKQKPSSRTKDSFKSNDTYAKEFSEKYNDDVVNMENSISELLGMNVKIQETENGGRVCIYFESLKQLDIILQKLTSDVKI